MDRPKNFLALSLILTLSLFVLLAKCPQAECGQDSGDLPDQNDVEPVMIALTRLDVNDYAPDANDQSVDVNDQILDVNEQGLDVNDQILELVYRIMNRSSHDIWVCNSMGFIEDSSEVYLAEDGLTLMIRKRLDVPTYVMWYKTPVGRYVRLRAGEDLYQTLSLTLPVRHNWVFVPRPEKPGIVYARCLVLDIGYHAKDLPRMVMLSEQRYPDPNMVEEVVMNYEDPAREGEHVLQITVDGVFIPYEDVWAEYTYR
jgi:hypothetical protein